MTAAEIRFTPECVDEHCITCGDQGLPLRIVALEGAGLARCRDDAAPAEPDTTVDVQLVGAVAPGDLRARPRGRGARPSRPGRRMKYVDEFRDAELGRAVSAEIASTVDAGRHYKVMEVCGGHTHSIYKYGVDDLLPPNVELVHGPGCPVCVIPMGRVDDGIAVAREPEVIFTCFGDMLRVPGAHGTLLDAKAEGADVRMVYSPLDALRIARENPDRVVVFFAIGFETTAPSTALTLRRAKDEGIGNFLCLCNHVTIVPPLRALLESPDLQLDGFIGPGPRRDGRRRTAVRVHPGRLREADRDLGLRAARPAAVGADDRAAARRGPLRGREPVRARRAVRGQRARRCGRWPRSSSCARTSSGADSDSSRRARCASRTPTATFDAEARYEVPNVRVADPKACQCGEVLKGVIKPWECKVFGSACTPEHAIGTCMVSPEGACAAYYTYGRFAREREVV